MRNVITSLLLATAIGGCAPLSRMNSAIPISLPLQDVPLIVRSGVQGQNMDHGVRPQDDLFEHANGSWLRTVEIPADRSRYGVDSIMAERAIVQQRALLEAARSADDADQRKAGELYASFMDEARIEQEALRPLAAELARIDAVRNRHDLGPLMARLDRLGVSVPLSSFIDPDARQSDRYAFWIYGSGLGLPERNYYLSEERAHTDTRAQYENSLARLLALAGDEAPVRSAREVLALETAIARTHWSRVDARDPEKTYNPVTVPDLSALAPEIDWSAYFAVQGLTSPNPRAIARQPSTVSGVGRLLATAPLQTWKTYFRLRLLTTFAPFLPKAFSDEHFALQRILQGVQNQPERWKRGVALVDQLMGEATGQMYVARHFPPDARQRADALVSNLISAYGRAILRAEWMDSTTKAEALAKLRQMSIKIGHPPRWRSYAALDISPTDLLGNVLRARELEADRQRARMTAPVDRAEWRMTAATVDAYYSPATNEIAFPAGILQPPLFDPAADDAYNYGSTGATIGHEIGHAFDIRGSRYDGSGNLRDWWSPADRDRFDRKAASLVEQFAAYEPVAGHRINGRLTLPENLADLAGLEIAYDAYLAYLGGREPPLIDGLTGHQRFFIGYAQSYMGKRRDALLVAQLANNPHSPERYRVNGIVRNMAAFYIAFDVQPGDRMYIAPASRVSLWSRKTQIASTSSEGAIDVMK